MRTTQQIFAQPLHQLELMRIGAYEFKAILTIIQSRSPSIKSSQAPQSDPPSLVQPITQQSSNSLAKKRRNEKIRQRYKKRRSLHFTTVQVQEVDHNQEMKHSLGARNEPDKHVVLQRMGVWECCWHTVLQLDWMIMVAGMTMIECGVNGMRRLGIE